MRELIALLRDGGNRQLISFKSFETPAWTERQAWICGYLAALEEIDKIINIEHDG